VPKRIATWNSARSVWETDQGTLLCEHSVVWSAIWPTSGMTRNGVAYERQPLALRMTGIAPSYGRGTGLLPTPDVGTGKRGSQQPDHRRFLDDGRRGHHVTLNDVADNLLPTPDAGVFEGRPETRRARQERERAAYKPGSGRAGNGFGLTIGMLVQDLMPTPTANRGRNETANRRPGSAHHDGRTLVDAAEQLLPTPQAYEADKGGSQDPDKRRATGHQVYLSDVIEQALMPTPRSTDGGPNARGSAGDPMLSGIAAQLPTPTGQNSHGNRTNNRGELLLPGLADRLPTPAARDWKSGASNLLGTNARPLNEMIETGMSSALMPTPGASDGAAGVTSRSGDRKNELLLGGLTRTLAAQSPSVGAAPRSLTLSGETALAEYTTAMLARISLGSSENVTTRKRSGRGKPSPDAQHPSQLSLTDAEITGSTPGSPNG